MKTRLYLVLCSAVILITQCPALPGPSPASKSTVAEGQAIADENSGTNWLSNGRTYSENHYSPLTSINTTNVKRLGLAWFLDLPNQGSLQATPLAVNGTLYFTGCNGRTFAVDALTGKQLWEFDPDLAHHGPNSNGLE